MATSPTSVKSESLAAIILCAGKGTRMKSEKAKVLHPLLGKPLCAYPLSSALTLGASPVVLVVGHQASEVRQAIDPLFPQQGLRFALQSEQKGTGHAVQSAEEALSDYQGPVLILYGDVPLLTAESLKTFYQAHQRASQTARGVLSLVTTFPSSPKGYGRIVREQDKVVRVVEEKDCTPLQRAIGECNAGIYIVDSKFLFHALKHLQTDNAQGELYLTDLVAMAAQSGVVETHPLDVSETRGVNDRWELMESTKALQMRISRRHMLNGVWITDPASTWIESDVEIGPDAEIEGQVSLKAGCRIGARVKIGQGSVLTGSVVGDETEIKPYSVLESAVVGPRCVIGPFARLRPETQLDEGVHIGNFVETKKTRIGRRSKANHLSYLGDADIGSGVNVGAGTITCNYDGKNKFRTVLGDNVFVGSDSQLVAPVTVGAGAYIGAGTTVTEDVPPMSLTLSRSPQVIKKDWVVKKKSSA